MVASQLISSHVQQEAEPEPCWIEPPSFVLDLQEDVSLPRKHRISQGPLAIHLGERVATTTFVDGMEAHRYTREVLRRIVSYPITGLIGMQFELNSVSDITKSLSDFLCRALPGMALSFSPDWHEHPKFLYGKYGFVHNQCAAPPHPDTGQAMAIEIFAKTVAPMRVQVESASYSNFMVGTCPVWYG